MSKGHRRTQSNSEYDFKGLKLSEESSDPSNSDLNKMIDTHKVIDGTTTKQTIQNSKAQSNEEEKCVIVEPIEDLKNLDGMISTQFGKKIRHKSQGGICKLESEYYPERDIFANNNLCVIPELPADLITSMEFQNTQKSLLEQARSQQPQPIEEKKTSAPCKQPIIQTTSTEIQDEARSAHKPSAQSRPGPHAIPYQQVAGPGGSSLESSAGKQPNDLAN